jgi:hypothetical protein
MGNNTAGTGAIVSNAKVCFWRQVDVYNTFFSGQVAGGQPSNYAGGNLAPNKPWDFYPGKTNWRPSRISEFQRTYYKPPEGSGTGVATGAKNSTGIIRLIFKEGSPANGEGSLYYFYLDDGYNGPGRFNWYTSTFDTTTQQAKYDFAVNLNAGLAGYVVDDRFCGGQMTGAEIRISGSCHYP